MSTSTVVLPSHLPGQVAERLPDSPSAADLADALELLLADPSALLRWLTSLVEQPERLAQVVAGSYWHANGFAKLVLHSAPNFRIRLHVWPAGEGRLGESDPHSHRWDFASTVLAGDGLEIAEFREAETGDDDAVTRYVYDGFGLVPDIEVFLEDERGYDVLTHERYTTVTTTIHTVVPKGTDLVATLVVRGPHVSSATAVYGTELDALVERPGRLIDAEDVRGLVTDVVATLAPRGGVSR